MKYLIPQYNAAVTVSASNQNALYPASNLTLATRRLKWVAASSAYDNATLAVDIAAAGYPVPPPPGAGSSTDTTYTDVVLSGVFADLVSIQVYGPWPTLVTPIGLTTETITDPAGSGDTWWFSFPTNEQPGGTGGGCVLTVARAPANLYVLSATNLWIGHADTLTGVRYPLDEQLEDTSIVLPLADGSLYTRFRPTLRTFSGSALETRLVASQFLRACARIGSRATCFHLAPALDDQFYVQGQFPRMPTVSHALPTLSSVSFAVREVL